MYIPWLEVAIHTDHHTCSTCIYTYVHEQQENPQRGPSPSLSPLGETLTPTIDCVKEVDSSSLIYYVVYTLTLYLQLLHNVLSTLVLAHNASYERKYTKVQEVFWAVRKWLYLYLVYTKYFTKYSSYETL